MELALGTVQFGLAYGVAGAAAPVAELEAKRILAAAFEGGVRRLDTAPVYGDVEERLAGLCGSHAFSIVSKIPPMPAGLDAADVPSWLRHTVEQSRRRIGDRLCGLIFHDAALPWGEHGALIRSELASLLDGKGIAIGSSHYGPETLHSGSEWPDQSMAQLPGNAYDQRVASIGNVSGTVEISMRSAFLQGLLLMDEGAAAERVPAAAAWLACWAAWCSANGLTKLHAAMAVAKSFATVDFCLVGVDTLAQFQAILAAWADVQPIAAADLAGRDPLVFDPRRWQT